MLQTVPKLRVVLERLLKRSRHERRARSECVRDIVVLVPNRRRTPRGPMRCLSPTRLRRYRPRLNVRFFLRSRYLNFRAGCQREELPCLMGWGTLNSGTPFNETAKPRIEQAEAPAGGALPAYGWRGTAQHCRTSNRTASA